MTENALEKANKIKKRIAEIDRAAEWFHGGSDDMEDIFTWQEGAGQITSYSSLMMQGW